VNGNDRRAALGATMNAMLRDLCGHQAWADAEHWRALETHPQALEDAAIRERLHHIYLVQLAFLCIAQGFPIVPTKLTDFSSMAVLKAETRRTHADLATFLDEVSPARLGEAISVPWFRDPPVRITVSEALTQAAMHSHYHRGQNATRLRELGGTPPLTDLIIWYWKGRPEAVWA
jgi:uncharacterized damage-inducible protein DinB